MSTPEIGVFKFQKISNTIYTNSLNLTPACNLYPQDKLNLLLTHTTLKCYLYHMRDAVLKF